MKRTFEEKQNLTEDDVRTRLKELSSPMIKSEYLENLLKRMAIQPNIKIFAAKNLSELYAQRGLWSSAGRVLESAAEAATVFSERKSLFIAVGVFYIKSMDYILADDAFRKAIDAASPGEKATLAKDIRNIFIRDADAMNADGKIAKAVKLYERMLRSSADISEKKKIMSNLVVLYDKLARIPDAIQMREALKNM